MAQYYTDPTTGQQVKIKKSHKFRNFVVLPGLGIIAIAAIATAAGSGGTSPNMPIIPAGNGPAVVEPAENTQADGHRVQYEITGNGTGSVTYVTDQNMSMAQDTEATLPWSHETTIDAYFAPLSVSAQHMSGSGPIGCKITVDGAVVSENHANGQYAMAMCTATLK